ncbi:MAG: alternative ribosome rescue aminoacyl-tRNA hydrolase ArfB [Spirochaetaceae bacterium]
MSRKTEEIRRCIEERGIEEFSRSSGPGGQHVNKTSSKVTLKIPLSELPVRTEEIRRIEHLLSGRMNSEGELVIRSSETRSQTNNRKRAYERALQLIVSALAPEKKRRPTSPSRGSKERRLESKKRRGDKKRLRKPPQER